MKSTHVSTQWKELVIGQDHAIDAIAPYINRHLAGLSPIERPVGNFFLLGPTGTGKTRTAESLAEVLHNDHKKVLKIDCGEFQLEHDIAKLIGAPPGYLGHKETQPLLSQLRVTGVASELSDISVILFDEIEKANASMWRLLLGILDKGTLRLADNQVVSFENAIIFMSSNLGAQEMAASISKMGFVKPAVNSTHSHMEHIGTAAMGKKFPPEFPNRIDEIITYKVLDEPMLRAITLMELRKIEAHIQLRLGVRTYHLIYGDDVVNLIAKIGTSTEYGARQLKRTITRLLENPLADDYIDEKILPGCRVNCRVEDEKVVWDIQQSSYVINEDGTIRFGKDPFAEAAN